MRTEPSAPDTIELAQALLGNAESLLSDADLLLAAGRRARAAALALMASEELSKLYLCVGAITGEDDVPRATSPLWTGHRVKMETAKALELAFIDEHPNFDIETVKAEVAALLKLKKATLYVDHEDGEVKRPGDLQVDAEAILESGRAQCNFLRGIFDAITPEVIAAMDEHREMMATIAEGLVDDTDIAGTARRLRAVTAAAVTGDAAALRDALESGYLEVHGVNGAATPGR